jgi:hypothetical protein
MRRLLSLWVMVFVAACSGSSAECPPEDEQAFCARLGKDCGQVTAPDTCQVDREVSCGACQEPESCGGGGEANVCGQLGSGFVISEPLTLDRSVVHPGESLRGRVVYLNNSGAEIVIRSIVIGCRPPGGQHIGGPYEDMAPSAGQQTVQPGASVTLEATRAFTAADPLGGWYCFATHEDSDGAYHDGPDVPFSVADAECVPESDPELCARLHKNCGEVIAPDNCLAERTVPSCGECALPQICGFSVPNVCGEEGGTAVRPEYNTGTGFFVRDGLLYDANGVEFRMRGVNRLHYDCNAEVAAIGMANSRSSIVRWNIDLTLDAASNVAMIEQASIDHAIAVMPATWNNDVTCSDSADALTSVVDLWVAQVNQWKAIERYMILNIANEWGPADSAAWRDAYITAIARLREAGYLCTLAIDAGGCGQDNADLVNYAASVFDSDPQRNVIFSQHIYGNFGMNGEPAWAQDLQESLDNLAALDVPVVLGEFGPGRNIGPSPTMISPGDIIQLAEARGLGWLAWAWDDPCNDADDTWFSLTRNCAYESTDDLTLFGQEVIEDPTHGLLALSRPATIFE